METFDGIVISQDPPGNTQQDPNTVVTLFVGVYVPPDDDRAHGHGDDHDHAVTARVRVAVLAGGRSSEHEISLASARSVVAALDGDRYETQVIEIGRDGAWALPPARRHGRVGRGTRIAADSDRVGAVCARRGRRRPAHPARPVRRGRDGPGSAGARRCPVRRLRRDGIGALHGQGSLQGSPPRPRHPCRPEHHASPGRPGREPVRLPRVRQARPARVIGRDLEGGHGGRARGSGRAGAPPRRQGARRGVPAGGRGRGGCARKPRPDRVGRRRDRRARRLVRLRRQVRRTAAWT